MIKDLSHQKFKRFKAGDSLLDQVTAERLNDILTMIEATRLNPGAGYRITRTHDGTTLAIDSYEISRPPKLWKVSLDDVDLDPMIIATKVINMLIEEVLPIVSNPSQFTSIFYGFLSNIIGAITSGNAGSASGVKGLVENILTPIYGIIDTVDDKVETMLDKIDPIRDTLERYFDARGKRPRSGDMIYTDEFGICYTIFKETEDEDGVYPTPNLIFRVPFEIGKTEETEGTKYYALTTFPMPDIAEIVKTVIKAVVDFVSALLGSSFEGLTQSIMDAIAQAIFALYDLLWATIEEILNMISDLWSAINSLASALDNNIADLLDRIGLNDSDISNLENQLSSAVNLSVIASDGIAHTIRVISDSAGSDQRIETSWIEKDGTTCSGKKLIWEYKGDIEQTLKDITWIDSDNGVGHRAKTLLWEEYSPNVVNVDWRPVRFIGTDGKGYQYPFLLRLDQSPEISHNKTSQPTSITMCEDGINSVTKDIVEIVDGLPIGFPFEGAPAIPPNEDTTQPTNDN